MSLRSGNGMFIFALNIVYSCMYRACGACQNMCCVIQDCENPNWAPPELLNPFCSINPSTDNKLTDSLSLFQAEKIDVYSFGMLAWELVHGIPPWSTLNDRELIETIVLNFRRPPMLRIENTPAFTALTNLIYDCLSYEPCHRPVFRSITSTLNKLVSTMRLSSERGIFR